MQPYDHCRFCEIPVDKRNPKANSLTAQLIQYHYIDEFFFYFSKPINEIVEESQSPEFAAFREMQVEVSRPKLGFAFYNPKDFKQIAARKAGQPKPRRPILADYKMMASLAKADLKKSQLPRRRSEEASDKRRYVRKRQQLPLRDGNVLNGTKAGFVDLESFETKLFDIYDPSFSSAHEDPQPPMKSVLVERLRKGAYPREAVNSGAACVQKSQSRVQIPLLCLSKASQKKGQGWSHIHESLAKAKQQTSQDPTRSKGFAGSENQSTQFSATCNLNQNGRRKQVLDSSKPNATRNSSSSRPPAKLLTTSPKFVKKKKTNIDSSLRPSKKSRRSRDHDGQRQPLTTTNSLFNSRSWKVLKSWDQFMVAKIKDAQAQESTRARLESRQSRKGGLDSREKKSSSQFLQYSTDHTRTGASKNQLCLGVSVSMKKPAASPAPATERALTQRERIHNSFKEKCNFKNAKQRGSRFPLWIGLPEGDDKKATREFVKTDGCVGFNTQPVSKSKRFDMAIGKLPFDCGMPHNVKDLRSKILRDKSANPMTQSANFMSGTRLMRHSDSRKVLLSTDKTAQKPVFLKAKPKVQPKKPGLDIKEWSRVVGLAADKGDLTSQNHFLTSRSCRMKERDNARIATERCFERPDKARPAQSSDKGKQKTASSVKKGC